MTESIGMNHHASYGQGVINCAALDDDSDESLSERVLTLFRSPSYTPPVLPTVALELQALAQRSDVETKAVVQLLEKDGFLAGHVLARAKSAAYGRGGPISLRDAVIRIGLRSLRDVVWEAAMNLRVFRAPGYVTQMEAVRRHCAATAQCAAVGAGYTSYPADYAFLCGLLHDVGIAVTLLAASEQKKPPRPQRLNEAIGHTHAETARLVTRHWGLPEEVQLVVGAHHEIRVGGFVHPLAAIVAVAQHVAGQCGAALHLGPERDVDGTAPPELAAARKALELNDKRIDLIVAESKKRLSSVAS